MSVLIDVCDTYVVCVVTLIVVVMVLLFNVVVVCLYEFVVGMMNCVGVTGIVLWCECCCVVNMGVVDVCVYVLCVFVFVLIGYVIRFGCC